MHIVDSVWVDERYTCISLAEKQFVSLFSYLFLKLSFDSDGAMHHTKLSLRPQNRNADPKQHFYLIGLIKR